MIGRRRLLALAGATAAAGRAAAQAPRRVAVVAPDPRQLARFDVFRQAMRRLGNAQALVETRFAAEHRAGLDALVAEVFAARPAVVVAVNTPVVLAALAARSDIPVVMAVVGDRDGVMGRAPHANATGVTTMIGGLSAKRLALLKEAVPPLARVLALYHPDDPVTEPQLADIAAAAPGLGLDVRPAPVREPDELAGIFDAAAGWGAEAVFRVSGLAARTTQRTINLARERRLPTMMVLQDDVRAGALMAYYASFEEHWERVATLVDRLLKGARAADLPIEQPTRFELVLNLATARAIGLALPPAFIARADEVVE